MKLENWGNWEIEKRVWRLILKGWIEIQLFLLWLHNNIDLALDTRGSVFLLPLTQVTRKWGSAIRTFVMARKRRDIKTSKSFLCILCIFFLNEPVLATQADKPRTLATRTEQETRIFVQITHAAAIELQLRLHISERCGLFENNGTIFGLVVW